MSLSSLYNIVLAKEKKFFDDAFQKVDTLEVEVFSPFPLFCQRPFPPPSACFFSPHHSNRRIDDGWTAYTA